MKNILIDTIQGRFHNRPPVWFMRQAGRILPEYLNLRKKYSFDQLMKNKTLASKVTRMPVDTLGVDAAILFSDILIIPNALGLDLEFTDKGPIFKNPLNVKDFNFSNLSLNENTLKHVYENINQVKADLNNNVPLLGFCGGPLTTLLFMFRGSTDHKNFEGLLSLFYSNKKKFLDLIEIITDASIKYVKNQISSGIDCFQLFETYCGIMPSKEYCDYILPFSNKILKASKDMNCPTIFFPKNLNNGLKNLEKKYCDYVSIDWQIDLEYARELLDADIGIQGNMDPRFFYSNEQEIKNYLHSLVDFGSKNHNWIFNLGHGFQPGINYEKVIFLVELIKNLNWKRK